MIFHRLGINITFQLVFLLGLGMLLVNIVIMVSVQRTLLTHEMAKGELVISAIGQHLTAPLASGAAFRDRFGKTCETLLRQADISHALVLNRHWETIYFGGENRETRQPLIRLTRQAMRSGKKATRFSGTTWGVFWQQKRVLMLALPIGDGPAGGIGITLPIWKIYTDLRQTQHVIFGYILINTLILTLIGFYRLSRITVRPLHNLLERAETFREDEEEVFFLHEPSDNEFNQLSKALNRMLFRISENRRQLRSTVRSLEQANADLKKAQNDVINAEKLASVGRLGAGIAHEIGNPVAIAMGYLDLLRQDDVTEAEKKEFVIRTENEIHRIHKIIGQLLDVSRPSAGISEAVSVHEIIEDLIEVCRFQPLMADIDLVLSLRAEPDVVRADPSQLRQVFLNLTLNAADAIRSYPNRPRGRLTIATCIVPGRNERGAPVRNMLKIIFSDNGVGISQECLRKIFDPFYTTKEPGQGTGLGLSVSFMIVEAAGGNIRAVSQKDKGTTMMVYLPLQSRNQ